MDDNIYAPLPGVEHSHVELSVATRVMQSFSNELSTLVSGNVKSKQTKVNTSGIIIPELMYVAS